MATERQIEANRRNGQKSTGPRTVAGKAKSRWNALIHGARAQSVVLDFPGSGEDPREFERLHRQLHDDLKPEGVLEEMRVEDIAVLYWRQARVVRAETADIVGNIEDLSEDHERVEELAKQFQNITPLSRRQLLRTAQPQTQLEAENCLQVLTDLRIAVGGLHHGNHDCDIALEVAGKSDCPKLWLASIDANVRSVLDDQQLSHKKKEESIRSWLEYVEKVVLALLPELEAREAQRRETAAARPLVPDAPTLDRLIRYEAHLTRQLDRAITSLLELQRHRGAHARLPLRPSRS